MEVTAVVAMELLNLTLLAPQTQAVAEAELTTLVEKQAVLE
jgi:hypothetical protein